MNYETTDYRHPNDPARRSRGAAGDLGHPIDVPASGSAKGPLIAIVAILVVLGVLALFSTGADVNDGTPPPNTGGATQSVPLDGTAGGANPAPIAPTAPAQGD